MSKQIQHRRGTTSEHSFFTGASGEITYNTTTKTLHAHDGVTAGGFPLVRADELAGPNGGSRVGYTPAGEGAVLTTLQAKLREFVSVKDFGAVGDGVTDDTEAIQKAYRYLRQQSPVSELYAGTMYLPRGNYLVNGTVYLDALGGGYPNSVIFCGDSAGATTITRTIDSGILFDVKIYLNLEFRDIRFNHITNTDRTTWTNTLFNLNGDGGGNRFRLSGLVTNNFAKIINFTGVTGNQDTNTVEKSQFNNCRTFLYMRSTSSSQAVVNRFSDNTWFGYIDKVFDIGGFGATHIDTCNVVQSGDFLSLHYTGSGNASQYLCSNVRFEYWNGPNSNNQNGTTRFVYIVDEQINNAFVKFLSCSVSPRSDMDPSVYQFDLQGGPTHIEVDGGTWSGVKIRTKGRSDKASLNAWWIKFRNLINGPNPSTDIIRTASAANASAHVPIIFENCRGISNITMRGPGNAFNATKSAGTGYDRNFNTISGPVGYLLQTSTLNTVATHSIPGYGSLQLVERIRFFIQLSGSGSPTIQLKAFSDEAKTNQIGSTITVSSFLSPGIYEVAVPVNTFTTEGVHLTVENTAGANAIIFGLIYVDTLSV